MASAEEENEQRGMDSLFEGMTLFNPAQIADNEHHLHPIPLPPDASTSTSSSPLPFAETVEENLFSDLTLITSSQTLAEGPQPQPHDSHSSLIQNPTTMAATTTAAAAAATATATSDVPSISRQISRKKRRPGIRIGYGRDTTAAAALLPNDHSLPDDHPPSLAASAITVEFLDDTLQDRDCSLASVDRDALPNYDLQDKDCSQASFDRDALPNHDLVSDSTPLTADEQQNEEPKASAPTEMKFEHIKAQIYEKLKQARDMAASVSLKRKDCSRRKRKAAENLNLASLKYRELEKKLEDACEAEDFETAEKLSEGLAAAEKEKQALLNAVRDAEADSNAIDSNMQKALECQIGAEEECASLLENFALDAAKDADLILKEAETVSSRGLDKWLSSTEAVELKKMELEIESQLINEARSVLNDSIEHSIKDDRRKTEYLLKKKDTLTDELNKLLALVKEKEEEIAQNDSNIKAVENRIVDVLSGFQGTQLSIDAEYDKLQSCLSQMELESVSLLMKKSEIDDLLSKEEDRRAMLRELARVSADEAKEYQEVVELRRSLLLSILKSREDNVRLLKTEERLSEDVQLLRQEVSAERSSLQELSSTKSSIQQEIASVKHRIFFIDKRVPELEAEKKVAAAARNFKEAARISAEAKTLCVEKEGVLSKMEGATSELAKLEENIRDTISRLQKTEGLISSKEKEVAMARFQRLRLIAGAASSERSAAFDLGDLEEANLLLAEAEAAEYEGKKLQAIWSFEEEFTNLPKLFLSMDLVSNLGRKQLAELAASVHHSAY
ncbi:uncharacterized protein LOC131161390 [Malania oleifera]|uniref:uncharacterized protein LOC131161390 n=1 Tax=Malania oleifera TaxID=397392 RepID=UPI0025AE9389|nr:uncharacterized protein LOC131161390 [Malania oleifera]